MEDGNRKDYKTTDRRTADLGQMAQRPLNMPDYKDYGFTHAAASHMHVRFMPPVLAFAGALGPDVRVLDVGCGNGFTCGEFLKRGCRVVGVDLSRSGI